MCEIGEAIPPERSKREQGKRGEGDQGHDMKERKSHRTQICRQIPFKAG